MIQTLGETPTGRIVNAVRMATALLGLAAIALSIAAAGFSVLRDSGPQMPWALWAALALFVAGVLLVGLSATYKIKSSPFLIDWALQEAQKRNASAADIEKLVKALEAHAGIAGVFNRLEFSGASLGTVASALIVMLIGLAAVRLQITADYSIFADIAKLLFGAFVGSYAGRAAAAVEQQRGR